MNPFDTWGQQVH